MMSGSLMKYIHAHKEQRDKLLTFLLVALALFLSLKNPYDTQSLVPNLEPYPDSLFYAYPALNVVRTGNFSMATEAVTPHIITPPLFSLYLVPFIAIRGNILDFFWAQIALLVIAVVLLAKILQKLFPDQWIIWTTALFFFVTNFYIFTMPSLLMGELISLTLFVGMIYIFVTDVSSKTNFFAATLGILFLLVKFSNAPVAAIWYFAYLLKLKYEKPSAIFAFIGWSAGASALFCMYLFSSGILEGHKNLEGDGSFGIKYFANNFRFYIDTFLGKSSHYLWFQEKLLSPLASWLGMAGLIYGLYQKKSRQVSIMLVVSSIALVLFMSTFITPDARYISLLLPVVSIGIGYALVALQKHMNRGFPLVCVLMVLMKLLVLPFSQSSEPYAFTLKKQIGLNYLHPENPWNYISVQEMNTFVQTLPQTGRPIYIGTFLPPHYVSFFAKGFVPVPLSSDQEFFSHDLSIDKLYTELSQKGDIYISQAYENNSRPAWPQAFQNMLKKYDGKIVHTGCFNSCSIYKLRIGYENKRKI